MHKALGKLLKIVYDQKTISGLVKRLHCKFLPHENYRDWELRGPSRENLHYLWKELSESQRNHMYVVDKHCNIYRFRGNPMTIIQGFPSTGKSCKDSVRPCKHLQCISGFSQKTFQAIFSRVLIFLNNTIIHAYSSMLPPLCTMYILYKLCG